ncbi:MAG: outer membrane beta-barrel protein [Gammaproteobacteria bacterium]
MKRRYRTMRRTPELTAAAVLCVTLIWSASISAQPEAAAALESPHWAYEIRVGRFEPDLSGFDTFYGDDSESLYALAGSYRFKDWLEVGGEYGHTRARGVGFLTNSEALGGSVRYQLNPVHVFANFVFQREPDQLVVPYLGIGAAIARYKQEVAQQSDSTGRTDVGYSARVGVRFMLGATRRPLSMSGSPYQRSFIFLEAQELSFDADTVEVAGQSAAVDLGGLAYSLGFRMEFDFN